MLPSSPTRRLYESVLQELKETGGSLSLETRQRFAALAYTRTASYDLAISSYLARQLSDEDLEFLEPFNPLENLVFIETETKKPKPNRNLKNLRFNRTRQSHRFALRRKSAPESRAL